MTLSETVFQAGRPLGRLTWDDASRVATFTPFRPDLKSLASKHWQCPVVAREAVQAEAQRMWMMP